MCDKNRVIKYQAWIPERGVMLQVNRMTFDNEGNVLHVVQDDPEEYARNLGAHTQYLKIILREFTGLLDKNGVEIYEGDVVQQKWNGKTLTMVVRYKQNSFVMDKEGSWYFNTEVIGNIHENPELSQ